MTLTVATARRGAADLLHAAGLSRERAEVTARAVVLADCWGVGSHGLLRLPYYLQRLKAGGYPPEAGLRTVTDTGPLLVYDGEGGIGHWQLWAAATRAAERCGDYGIASAAVGNSGHCGALGAYTLPALERGLLALVFSHGPAVLPPWTGDTPLLSTSPLAAGIPCRPRPAIVDMASSAVARGKIAAYAQRGEELPPGWGLDSEGRPTLDAKEALRGMLAPLGGAKGYALAFLVESLSAGLVGPTLSVDTADMFTPDDVATPQRIAHTVVVLDPERFDVEGGAGARRRLAALAQQVDGAGGRLPGARRRWPEEIPDDTPLDLDTPLLEELRGWGARLGVPGALEPQASA